MVVGISTYLETEYNYSKILCMKLGEKKNCNVFHIQTSCAYAKVFLLNGFVTSIFSFQPLSET